MNNPLIRVRSRNHLCDREVLLQEVEGDFAEVEVLSQLRIGEKNLSRILSHICFTMIKRAINSSIAAV